MIAHCRAQFQAEVAGGQVSRNQEYQLGGGVFAHDANLSDATQSLPASPSGQTNGTVSSTTTPGPSSRL